MRKVMGSLFADMLYRKRRQKSRKTYGVPFLYRQYKIFCRFLRKAGQANKIAFGQCKKIIGRCNESFFHEQFHNLQSKTFDVERGARGKIFGTPLQLRK